MKNKENDNSAENPDEELNRLALEEYKRRFPDFEIKKPKTNYFLHIGLFIATFITVTLGGVYWGGNDPYELQNFTKGLPYSCLLFLLFQLMNSGITSQQKSIK